MVLPASLDTVCVVLMTPGLQFRHRSVCCGGFVKCGNSPAGRHDTLMPGDTLVTTIPVELETAGYKL